VVVAEELEQRKAGEIGITVVLAKARTHYPDCP
jgi:hypothetical protein